MNTERFEQLRSSIVEAGLIKSNQQRPSREFVYPVVEYPENSEECWAICIDSDDANLLIPRKLYWIKLGEKGIWVRDEENEMTVCDKEDFFPLAFAPEVEELLAEVA